MVFDYQDFVAIVSRCMHVCVYVNTQKCADPAYPNENVSIVSVRCDLRSCVCDILSNLTMKMGVVALGVDRTMLSEQLCLREKLCRVFAPFQLCSPLHPSTEHIHIAKPPVMLSWGCSDLCWSKWTQFIHFHNQSGWCSHLDWNATYV